jgi:hypothetical protein
VGRFLKNVLIFEKRAWKWGVLMLLKMTLHLGAKAVYFIKAMLMG